MLVKKHIQMNIRVMLVAILTIVVSLAISSQVSAQSTGASTSTNVLKISPVRSDVEIKAGESLTIKTVVTNLTKQPITVKPIMNDFVAGDERGTPALILDADKFAPTHSLKRFMKPLKDVTIPASKAQLIEVVITVPKNAQAGGYFGAVRFAPTNPEAGGQVNLTGSAASLVLLTVPGPAVEKLNLTDYTIQQGGKNGTYFQSSNDLQLTTRFESKSNIQVAPFGKVSVKEGDKVVYEYDFNTNTPREMILPDSARRWDVPLKNIGSFGHYTVNATFTYGKKNQTIEQEVSFWVVPQIVIIAAIAGAVVLLLLIIGLVFFLTRRRRRKLQYKGGGGFRL